MFTNPTVWELVSLFSKFSTYIGIATICGGSFCLWMFCRGKRQLINQHLSYMLMGSVLGLHASILYFFVQVGAINDSGLSGMLDWDMMSFLYSTELGGFTLQRLVGFALMIIACVVALRQINQATKPVELGFYLFFNMAAVMAIALISQSFRVVGHVSVLGVLPQIGISLHVISMSLWLGSLIPLLLLMKKAQLSDLQSYLKRFGDIAVGILIVLLGTGVLMLWQLLEQWSELITTGYGLSLVIKFVLVAALLAVPALNKLYLVPRLLQGGEAQLKRAILSEMALMALILSATAYLSTVVGPMHM